MPATATKPKQNIVDVLRNKDRIENLAADEDIRDSVVQAATGNEVDAKVAWKALNDTYTDLESFSERIGWATGRARFIEMMTRGRSAPDEVALEEQLQELERERIEATRKIDSAINAMTRKLDDAKADRASAAVARDRLIDSAPEWITQEIDKTRVQLQKLERQFSRSLAPVRDEAVFEDGKFRAVLPGNGESEEKLQDFLDRKRVRDEEIAAMQPKINLLKNRIAKLQKLAIENIFPLPSDFEE